MTDPGKFPFLDEATLVDDPIKQFKMWFDDAIHYGVLQPEAMMLSTATTDGRPSGRVVLLKSVDESGFVFYTNYESRKGRELASNPRAALTFFWPGTGRQVRIEGTVERLTDAASDLYFSSRPRNSQLSSMTSAQSEPIGSREALDRRFHELRQLYEGKVIPRPAHWGGYRVHPQRMEFWQSRMARLNDRVLYAWENGAWTRTRLQP